MNAVPDLNIASSPLMKGLRQQGIDKQYRFQNARLYIEDHLSYPPEELSIRNIIHFEAEGSRSNLHAMYIIQTKDTVGYLLALNTDGSPEAERTELANFLRCIPERQDRCTALHPHISATQPLNPAG